MRALFIGTYEDESYFKRFERLPALIGNKVSAIPGGNAVTDVPKVAALCRNNGIDFVICAQDAFLRAALESTTDWVAPASKAKKISLDDYAGSIIHAHRGNLKVLVVRPLKRLITVDSEAYVLNRYLSKLTQPEKWLQQTEFKWKDVTQFGREDALQRLLQAQILSIDIETVQDAERNIDCLSYTGIFLEDGKWITESYGLTIHEAIDYEWIAELNDSPIPKVFQNGLYDNTYFLRFGVPVRNWLYDTFHLFHSWLAEMPKSLDFLAAFLLPDFRYWKHESEHDKLRYCCKDSWATANALLALMAEMPEWAFTNYIEHEFPYVFPSIHAALEGFDVNMDQFNAQRDRLRSEAEQILAQLRLELGEPEFNPNSPKQMGELFKLLGAQALGIEGTDKIAAAKLAFQHPLNAHLIDLCKEYKSLTKVLGTYLVPEKLWKGRLYYSLNPGRTDTGRAASEESAFWCGFQIQNVPGGEDVKSCLEVPDPWRLAEADKAQSEARCVGYMSGEQKLIDLVESPHDYHSWNASAFFGIPYEQIYDEASGKKLMPALRDLSKRTNHGANYNMTAPVLLDTMGPKNVVKAKHTLKLPADWSMLKVCEFLLKQYANTYPGVKKDWYSWILTTIKTTNKLISSMGHTRWFFGDMSKKPNFNAAVAHGPQNLSVMFVNREWYTIWRATVYGDLRGHVRVKAQIHDSILFAYKEIKYAQQVQSMMTYSHPITDCKGITRQFKIPTDLSLCKVKGKETTRVWAEVK